MNLTGEVVICPSVLVTWISTLPASWDGEVTVRLVGPWGFVTVATAPPKSICASGSRFSPTMVTSVPPLTSPTQTFLAYQDALNRRDFVSAYGLLSTYFRDSDLCKLKQLCDPQTFGSGFRGREFVSAADIRNEHRGWSAAYWVFDVTLHPEATSAVNQNTICMLLENGQWKVHGILPLGSKSCG